MTANLYGIRNCDTVKKAIKWLESEGLDYRFHDFRSDGLAPGLLARWCETTGWEVLLNKRSTTWRQLDDHEKSSLDAPRAQALMLAHPTLIKRPVLDTGTRILVGFSEAAYRDALGD